MGYGYISMLQIALTALILFSLPLWKNPSHNTSEAAKKPKALTIPQILKIPGAKAVLIMFFCYCALEQTAGF